MSKITIDGAPLTPGVNLDRIDVAAGVAEAVVIGYSDGNMRMLAEYCLGRWAKGEEGRGHGHGPNVLAALSRGGSGGR